MIEAATGLLDSISSPPLVPVERPIDFAHLSRMTLGDRELEIEVLQLFDRQARMLTLRMRDAGPAAIAASAHTLKGSARGIGAWRVARAADAVECAASANKPELHATLGALGESVEEAHAAITELLRAH
jgi:HPt (histidine-containing phosphotransfer) domain-containing protein